MLFAVFKTKGEAVTEVKIIDGEARQQALDIQNSYCVQAPAGSGKTELLTQRLLKLLISCEEPEEILAFTFTRKAAFEMRQRLLKSLRQDEPENLTNTTKNLAKQVLNRNQEKNWRLLENPQRLQIKTIDSFNTSICAQLPIVSGLGGQVKILEDAHEIYEEAISLTLAKLENGTDLSQSLEALLEHLDNNLGRTRTLIISLLNKRDQWLGHILRVKHQENLENELTSNLISVIEEVLTNTQQSLAPYTTKIMSLLSFAEENLSRNGDNLLSLGNFNSELPESTFKSASSWRVLAAFFLTQKGEYRKLVNKKSGFPAVSEAKSAEEKENFKNKKTDFKDLVECFNENPNILIALNDLLILPNANYSKDEWEFIAALTQVLLDVVSELNLLFNQRNLADFIHVSARALQALSFEQSISDLALRLDYKINHILVDEFQDTSHQQIELLEMLMAGWQENDGRTLFIVGDGMQSCYRFRNADVGLFLKARDQGIADVSLKSLQLKMNFRSTNAIVSWVNKIFYEAFPKQDNISRGAVSYSASQAVHNDDLEDSGRTTGVLSTLFINNSVTTTASKLAREIEAKYLIEQIEELPKDKLISIAILVRTRSHLSEIIPALRNAGKIWNASDIDSLSSFSAVKDLLSLLKALTNLADISALYALLRAPFIGLAIEDIHKLKLKADKHESSLWQSLCSFEDSDISPDGKLRLQAVSHILQKARVERSQSNLREWLEATWLQLGGPSTLKKDHELQYIERFFSLVESELSNADILDIHKFEHKCDNTYLGSTHNPNTNLQIMTIHKAKGLEFDYVLIPGLHRKTRSNESELFLWKDQSTENENRLLLAPLNAKGKSTNSTYLYLKNESDIHNKLENTRLLYIAVTRAKQKAFLYAELEADSNGELKAPNGSSLLATIWPALEQDQGNIRKVKLEPTSQTKQEAPSASLETLRLKHEYLAPPIILGKFLNQEASSDTKDEHLHLVEKKIGDIIHDSLRLLVEENIDVLTTHNAKRYEHFWQTELKHLCSNSEEMQFATSKIKNNIKSSLNHAKADWIFDSNHQDSACELPISDYRRQWRKELVVDRTFIENNIRWIIDYKSTSPRANQNLNDFLEEQELLYTAQLQRYAELFQAMDDKPVKTALFFTSIPYWHEIEL